MTEYSKFNIVYRLQRWLDSVPGQTFLNYAYSWGASIVILGTLFKLTHLPGANIMLYLGMGTEVIVFFISAFDRPFDKTSIGKEIPTHVTDYDDNPDMDADDDIPAVEDDLQGEQVAAAPGMGGGVQGGTVIIGGFAPSAAVSGDAPQQPLPEGFEPGTMGVAGVAGVGNIPQQPAWVAQQQQVSPEMEEATSNYVDELKKLTDMLARVSEQSARLTRDSEEMENLNRTLTVICKVYEM